MDNVGEGLVDILKLEFKAGFQRPAGLHILAGQQDVGDFAQSQTQNWRRYGEDCRPVQGMAQRAGELSSWSLDLAPFH